MNSREVGMDDSCRGEWKSGENGEKSVEFLGGGGRVSIRMGRNRWSKLRGYK